MEYEHISNGILLTRLLRTSVYRHFQNFHFNTAAA